MLIEFSVTNYRSIKSTQTLSLIADSKLDLPNNTFLCPGNNKLRLLRSAVIYGANASGKSNIIRAISFMKEFILTGSFETQKSQKINITPFAYTDAENKSPSEFEVIFLEKGIRYQYGFSLNKDIVIDEWLYAFPKNKLQKWFERTYNFEKKNHDWYFSQKIYGKKSTWKDLTRDNALFLSTASQLNSEQLSEVLNWFRKLAVIGHDSILSPTFTIDECKDDDNKKKIITRLLKAADKSIVDIKFKKRKIKEVKFPDGIPDGLREMILDDIKSSYEYEVNIIHNQSINDEPGSNISINLKDESDGTKKLFAYSAPLIDALVNGNIFIVDELERSFHPQLLMFILRLVHNNEINRNNGQLIFATHNTVLLQKKILRRDQIWFIKKSKSLESILYPLTDFHPRREDSLQDRYLKGCYGAIPFTNDIFNDILEENEKP